MDMDQLKAEHPAIFAEACKIGADAERNRVSAHLKMGKSHNAMDVAEKAIAEGTSLQDDLVMADYLAAGKNAADQTAAAADDQVAADAADAPSTEENEDTLMKATADLVCGVEEEN